MIWASRCRSRDMSILINFFVGILSLYVIDLDIVSLFADSSFTFLAMLSDVFYQFK